MKVAQSCPTLCKAMDCNPPGFSVHGILYARRLEWVAFHFSRGSFQPRDWTQVSCLADGFFTFWATQGSPTDLSSFNSHSSPALWGNWGPRGYRLSLPLSSLQPLNKYFLFSEPWCTRLTKPLVMGNNGYTCRGICIEEQEATGEDCVPGLVTS